MIKSIQFKFGANPQSIGTTISATPVTILVGPNNSGKSRALNEIESFCRNGKEDKSYLLLKRVEFLDLSEEKMCQFIERFRTDPPQKSTSEENTMYLGNKKKFRYVNIENLKRTMANPNAHKQEFCASVLDFLTLMLDGVKRIRLVDQQESGDLLERSELVLQKLFCDEDKRRLVREILFDAFDKHFVIDPTDLRNLRIRYSLVAPVDTSQEQALDIRAREFHSAGELIEKMSDGIKAFTGIIISVVASEPAVLLIDEPEAFLHPPLAAKLGREISRAATSIGSRVFVATHSAQFLMGCIQSEVPLNIVRLTYREKTATARVLPSDEVLKLMRHPLLRSTGLLAGLFYEYVVVTEGDADRAFYQEVNERLLQFKPELGIPNCLFINSQGKSSIHTMISLLRKLGIPAAAIVDIDLLKDGGKNWMNLMKGAYIPKITSESLALMRTRINDAMVATRKCMKRDGGINILDAENRHSALNFFNQLDGFGVFTVRIGELESWLKDLKVGGKGPEWLVQMFERLGNDPDHFQYVKPGSGDVWEFIMGIRGWLMDPNRAGIPTGDDGAELASSGT